jgi:hypothetical protein
MCVEITCDAECTNTYGYDVVHVTIVLECASFGGKSHARMASGQNIIAANQMPCSTAESCCYTFAHA